MQSSTPLQADPPIGEARCELVGLSVQQFRSAFNAGDVEAIAGCESDDLLKLRQGLPPEIKAKVVRRLPATLLEFDGHLEVTNDEILAGKALAVARGSLTVTLTPKAGGEARVLRRRFLEVWRLDGARWRVCRTMDSSATG